jgi:hypothetical protein
MRPVGVGCITRLNIVRCRAIRHVFDELAPLLIIEEENILACVYVCVDVVGLGFRVIIELLDLGILNGFGVPCCSLMPVCMRVDACACASICLLCMREHLFIMHARAFVILCVCGCVILS